MSTTSIAEPVERDALPVPAILASSSWFASPWIVVAVAFGVRVILCLVSHRAESKFHLGLQVIGREAGFIAWSLSSGKGFSNPFPGYEAATGWLAPVFPFLWSIGYRIFDPNTSDGGVYFCQIMNSAFSALTCWPVYWLGKKVFSSKIGLVASWTWVFLPLAILFPLEWAWDQSLSALVLALLLCAVYKLREAPATSWAWSAYGVSWGLAAMVNPTLSVMLPFFLAWIAFCRWKIRIPSIRPLLTVVGFFVLSILPWTARNYYKLDGLMFIKSNFGLELWLGNNPVVPPDAIYSSQLHPMNNPRQLLQLAFSGEPEYMRARQRAALSFIRAHPWTFVKLLERRVLDTWTAVYDSREDKWMRALHLRVEEIYFCAILSALSLAGMVLALRKNTFESLPLALCVVVFPIPYYITHTSLRYRHPIDPLLTLFAVFAISQILCSAYDRRTRGRGNHA